MDFVDDMEESNGVDYGPDFFRNSGLPMPPDFPSPFSFRKQASSLSPTIFSSYNLLRNLLDRYESQLRKRWLKKSKEQRKRILLAAFPDMPATHRPDFEAFRQSHPAVKSGKALDGKARNCYMMPYINIEDLTQGKLLLLFINSRGRNPPHMFAHADLNAMRLGHVTGNTMPIFLNQHTMYMDGKTPGSYGRLVSWDEDEDAFDMMFSGRAVNPGEGLLILEIQKKVMEFLVDCCFNIFHDVDKATLLANGVQIQPEPPALTRDPNEWPTLAAMAAESPYRVPAKLDFEQLVAVIAGRRAGAKDHIWALREDPGYFLDAVGDVSEHRVEVIPDVNNRRHPHLYDTLFLARVYGSMITDAYGSFLAWDYLFRQTTELARLRKNYSSVISPTRPLPKEFMKALLLFRHSLNQISKEPIDNLRMGFPASPPLRSSFVRHPQVRGSTKMRTEFKERGGSDFLMWMIRVLFDDTQLFKCRLPDLMDEFNRFVESNKMEKERLSSWVIGRFSDLGLIAGSLQQINLYQPWAESMDYEETKYSQELQKEYVVQLSPFAHILSSMHESSMLHLRLESPLDGRFTYPSDKRRTEQRVQTMRKAEQNLDLFWESIDKLHHSKTRKSLNQTVKGLKDPNRKLERTPEWVTPAKPPQPDVSENDVSDPFSHLSLENQKPESFKPSEQKTNRKQGGLPVLPSLKLIGQSVNRSRNIYRILSLFLN